MSENQYKNQVTIFREIEKHLLEDEKPSLFLDELYNHLCFRDFPFDMLYNLKKVEQNPIYHPEGNVWIHTKMVVDEAAGVRENSKNPRVFMWAALLHDIGKEPATKVRKGKITAYNHDKIGAGMAREFLEYFLVDRESVEEISNLVRYHMQILYLSKNSNMTDLKTMRQKTDISEIALLGLCDRMGRKQSNYNVEYAKIEQFLRQIEL